jgi:hypothetical protein
MSPANACQVRLSELHSDCRVFTLDVDFLRYRGMGGNSFRCWRLSEM